MSVAVSIDGEIVHEAAMGVRVPDTLEVATSTDKFRIASISKTITAITALQLIEDGVVGLDDPIGSIVADAVGVASPTAGVAGLTLRQLLTHTSGFPQYENLFFRNQVSSCEEAATVGLTRSLQGAGLPLQQHELLRARSADRAAHRTGLRTGRLRAAAHTAGDCRDASGPHPRSRPW